MVAVKNVMEIFVELDKSNCRLCGEKTCLAFAGAVFKSSRKLEECPRLHPSVIRKYQDSRYGSNVEERRDEHLEMALEEVLKLDFTETSVRIGGLVRDGILYFNVLGKRFGLTKDGRFLTDLHINPWVMAPLLTYLCSCRGKQPSGEWISFREIPNGQEKYNLFKKRTEDVLKGLGDKYPDFFSDVVQMFDGREVEEQFASDVSVVLYPFPLVPLMICYWMPEEGMGSKLNLFFDSTIGENLGVDAAFSIGAGLAQMFEKLANQHAF
ncbi:DUF3786 domain-containing protein [Desulforhopalus singaporensis]|uniref:Putative Fe-S cluster n=1 Tax=Desulforhopalus singaporensis TaxID=91360 RepID=A0A1H0TPG0_9BACT|nr:DUF3786 domain-containing protein [Desulforhopalus singaporensis]SDP55665.1 Putative Fe-S cluster [Desulforhopalus singaporensis]